MSHTLSGQYATPLRLELGRSRRVWLCLTLLHGAPLVMLPFMQLPSMPTLLVALVLLLSYLRYRRLYSLTDNPDSVRTLVWGPADRLQLTLACGRRETASLLPQVFVQHWLVILHLNQNMNRSRHLIVLPDMLDTESFRRLRVRLLLEMKQAAGWKRQ